MISRNENGLSQHRICFLISSNQKRKKSLYRLDEVLVFGNKKAKLRQTKTYFLTRELLILSCDCYVIIHKTSIQFFYTLFLRILICLLRSILNLSFSITYICLLQWPSLPKKKPVIFCFVFRVCVWGGGGGRGYFFTYLFFLCCDMKFCRHIDLNSPRHQHFVRIFKLFR